MRRLTLVAALVVLGLPGCQKGDKLTAPALVATCGAQPTTGLAPLSVTFQLTVSGAEGPFQVVVSYGDGQSGTNPDLPHPYATSGVFTAAFTVTTATQSARCSTTVAVLPSAVPSPPSGSNRPPTPVYKSTPAASGSTVSGTAPLAVRWNMCATTDPDQDLLYFLMDFDGDGRFDSGGTTGAHCRKDYVYAAGTYHPRLCVHDMTASGEALHDDQCRTFTVLATP